VTYPNHFYEAVEILDKEPDLNASDADAGLIETMLASFQTPPKDETG
jgi:hypothetical protein